MSNFAITASSSVKLAPDGPTTVSVTVQNTGDARVKAAAEIVPLEDTPIEWLRLQGPTEHEFEAGEVHPFTVEVNPDLRSSSGRYPFRIDVFDVSDKEENFAEGPVIGALWEEVEEEKKRKPWLWLIAAAVLVLIAGATYILWPSGSVIMEDLRTLAQNEAVAKLNEAGLKHEIVPHVTQQGNRPGVGTVIEHDPKKGEKASKGSTVTLKVEVAASQVPKMRGWTVDKAFNTLTGRGLGISSRKEVAISRTHVGRIVGSKPKASSWVQKGGDVTLVIGIRFRGQLIEAAVLSAQPAELVISPRINQWFNNGIKPRMVAEPDPENER